MAFVPPQLPTEAGTAAPTPSIEPPTLRLELLLLPNAINPLSNPKYSSHMAPIFMEQVENEMVICEAQWIEDELRLEAL